MGAAGVAAAAAALTPPREQAPDPPVTVRAALGAASARLRARGMATPWLDATVLLAHSLGVSKERLFAAYRSACPSSPGCASSGCWNTVRQANRWPTCAATRNSTVGLSSWTGG